MTFVLRDSNSVANHFLAEMRDVEIQKDGLRFRKNLERVGELLAYEISKELNYTPQTVQTPLGKSSTQLIDDELVLITILRAGVPFYQGFLTDRPFRPIRLSRLTSASLGAAPTSRGPDGIACGQRPIHPLDRPFDSPRSRQTNKISL